MESTAGGSDCPFAMDCRLVVRREQRASGDLCDSRAGQSARLWVQTRCNESSEDEKLRAGISMAPDSADQPEGAKNGQGDSHDRCVYTRAQNNIA